MSKNNICHECGMLVNPSEYHPYEFCILQKNGQDPRRLYNEIKGHLSQAKPAVEWHENIGVVLWWRFPIEEPPYCGTPLDSDWIDEYYTHWTPIVDPSDPK